MSIAPLSPTQTRIAAAAGRCFARAEVQATTLGEVAAEAGISRRTVYRLFRDRQGLIVALLRDRFRESIEALRRRLLTYGSFAEAIVEGHVFAMAWLESDALFQDLVTSEESHGIDLILKADRDVAAMVQSVWRPVFDRARLEGTLRSALPTERLIEGGADMAAMLLLRTDLDNAARRRFFADFLLPAMVGLTGEFEHENDRVKKHAGRLRGGVPGRTSVRWNGAA